MYHVLSLAWPRELIQPLPLLALALALALALTLVLTLALVLVWGSGWNSSRGHARLSTWYILRAPASHHATTSCIGRNTARETSRI